MITVNFFAILGLMYIFSGIIKYKIEWVDKLFIKIWGFDPPSRFEQIRLGIACIFVEIMIDILINTIPF